MKNENKIQYSKILPLLTGAIFAACLFVGFITDFSTVVDVSFYVTAVTVSGGIFSATVIWYMKKSQSENIMKLKIELYKIASDERYKYNKKMIILQDRYNVSDDEIIEIENNSPMNEYEESALASIEESLNTFQSEAESSIELQTY